MNQPEGLTKAETIALKAETNSSVRIIRALIPMIPIVGGVASGIDKLYEFWIKDIETKNTEIYIKNIDEKKILEKIESLQEDDRWDELIKHGFIKSLRCNKEGKIRRIVDILNGKCEDKIKSFNDAEDLINIVSELSENEAVVLQKIYNVYAQKSESEDSIIESNEIMDNDIGKWLDFLCGRLVGKGLIKEVAISWSTPDDVATSTNKKYELTNVGILLFSNWELAFSVGI